MGHGGHTKKIMSRLRPHSIRRPAYEVLSLCNDSRHTNKMYSVDFVYVKKINLAALLLVYSIVYLFITYMNNKYIK